MNSKLREKLDIQLKIEKDSVETYTRFIEKISEVSLKDKISAIRDSEIEHVRLVEEMITIMGRYPDSTEKSWETSHFNGKIKELLGFTESFSSVEAITGLETYPKNVERILRSVNLDCVYISYNKFSRYIKKVLEENNIPTANIKFASCVKGSDNTGDAVDPEALTDISIMIEGALEEKSGKCFVLVDSVSAFTTYHDADHILKFVSFINSKIMSHGSGIIWLAINDGGEEKIKSKIGQMCDKAILL